MIKYVVMKFDISFCSFKSKFFLNMYKNQSVSSPKSGTIMILFLLYQNEIINQHYQSVDVQLIMLRMSDRHIQKYIYIYRHMYTYISIHVYMSMYIHIYIVYVYVYIHTYVYIYIYIWQHIRGNIVAS